MWICLALLELFCAPTSYPAADSIYWQGFDEMYISYDRPSGIVWSIDSTPSHDAAFVTSQNYLNDGKVSVPTRMTWDTGAQTTPRYVMLSGSITLTIPKGGLVAFALLMPKTPYAVPAGVVTYLTLVDGLSNAMQVQTQTVALNDGAVAAIGVATNPLGGAFDAVTVQVQIFNAQASGAGFVTWASPGQTFDVGEIWFGNLVEFKNTADPSYGLTDPTTNRRSHNNTPWPLFIKPYRVWTFSFAPMNNAAAYTGSNNFDAVRYQLSTAEAALVLPRIYNPGTTTQNTVDIAQFATFGRPDSIDALVGVRDAQGLWTAKMVFSEAPP